MKILIVEDEERAARYLKKGLSEAGYLVEIRGDGVDGLHAALEGDHDLLILDVQLPGIDGYGVLDALRRARSSPVLMLTARSDTASKVRAFDLGADDYLVKPFEFPELLARVRALLRRGSAQPAATVYAVADLEVDLFKRRAMRGQRRLDLTAKEFSLLALLAEREGEPLSRTQIASLVWDIHFDSETNVVDVAIRRLRAKIDDEFERKLIHTVRGVGYVLEDRSRG